VMSQINSKFEVIHKTEHLQKK